MIMQSRKRNKIFIVASSVLAMVLILIFVASMMRTGTNESQFTPGETANGRIDFTLPEAYTWQKEDSLVFLRPETAEVKSVESRFTFSGTCDKKFPLSCNGADVPISDTGVFAVEYPLTNGANTFVFTYGSITKTFTVEYSAAILRQVAPQGITEAGPGATIEILVLANRNASLYANIGGQRVALTVTDRNAFQQSEGTKDYATFEGYFPMPSLSANTSLGQIQVVGSLNGETEEMFGGELRLIADNTSVAARAAEIEKQQNLISFYTTGGSGLLTPYADSGNGTAQMMCEILKDKTETTPASDPNDFSNPLYTPLPKGTFDYVTGIFTYEDELMYILASNRKVYAKDAKLLSPAFALPTNTVAASSVEQTANSTDFYFQTGWMPPVSVVLAPQPYYTGYQGRAYNVSDFTAEYLDITFYHSVSAGQPFSQTGSDVISGTEWIPQSDGTVTLRCYLRTPGKFYGYSVSLKEDGRIQLSIKNRRPSNGKTVILDPGHGGSDPGALGAFTGIQESAVTLALAGKVAAILQNQGIHVLLTRTADTDVSLNDRNLAVRNYKPDAFVSIHCDSSTSAASSGTHTFYYENFSMPLANAIHNQMVSAYQNNLYVPGSTEYAQADKGIKFYPFQVNRVEECPSVLVETGFLSNATDCSILVTDACQDVLATAIANGIIAYFNENS